MRIYKSWKTFIVNITLLILISGLLLVACNTSKTDNPTDPTTTSPLPTKIPSRESTRKKKSPTETAQYLSLPNVEPGDVASSIPSTPTVEIPVEPSMTFTPVPPVVATPMPPQFPLSGIEIQNFVDPQIEKVAQANAYWIRFNALIWSVVEPVEKTRDWGSVSTLERALENASNQGLKPILIVRGTPAWAQKLPGVHCGPILADKLQAFANFMYDTVARYSQPPYNVKYYELGNEPDVDPGLVSPGSEFGCWGDASDAYYGGGYYAEMLKAVYPAIKKADPEAQVMVGGLLMQCDPVNPPEVKGQPGVQEDCSPTKFIEGVLRNGGGDYLDGVSFHAYDYYYNVLGGYGNSLWRSSSKTTGPVLLAKANYLRSLLTQYGHPEKFLMNTEMAVLCGNTGFESPCQQEDWKNTKTYYVIEANTAAATLGLRANIWYSLTGWRDSGLVNSSLVPLPAYQALQFNTQILQGAIPFGEVTLYQGVTGFAFQIDGRLLWVLWSEDGQDHTIPLGSLPSAIYGALGESLPVGLNHTITLSPVYIEW